MNPPLFLQGNGVRVYRIINGNISGIIFNILQQQHAASQDPKLIEFLKMSGLSDGKRICCCYGSDALLLWGVNAKNA